VWVAAVLGLAAGGLVALTVYAQCQPTGRDCMGPALHAMAVIISPFIGGTGGLVAGAVVGGPFAMIHTLGLRHRQRDEILARVGACSAAQLAEIVGPLTRDPARDTRVLARMVIEKARARRASEVSPAAGPGGRGDEVGASC
jgi:hypothetical protein